MLWADVMCDMGCCLDLCLKNTTDCFMNLVGSRTQISVSYAASDIMFICRAGCLDNVVSYSSVDDSSRWFR